MAVCIVFYEDVCILFWSRGSIVLFNEWRGIVSYMNVFYIVPFFFLFYGLCVKKVVIFFFSVMRLMVAHLV